MDGIFGRDSSIALYGNLPITMSGRLRNEFMIYLNSFISVIIMRIMYIM